MKPNPLLKKLGFSDGDRVADWQTFQTAELRSAILIWFPLRGKYLEQVQKQVLDLNAEKHARLTK